MRNVVTLRCLSGSKQWKLELAHWLNSRSNEIQITNNSYRGRPLNRVKKQTIQTRRKRIPVLLIAALLTFTAPAPAAVRYVDVNSTNATPPYTNWATAATNIQDAVDAAVDGDQILVTNGVYRTGGKAVFGTMRNRLVVDKAITVQSMNGPKDTYIVGAGPRGPAAVRCVYLTNWAMLVGFTLTNGTTQTSGSWRYEAGGGVYCEGLSAVVSNCVLAGNSASWGGGAYYGTLNNCTLSSNMASGSSGGADFCTLNNCVLTGNITYLAGGGATVSTLNNCLLRGNSANQGGGAASSVLNNCVLTANFAFDGGGSSAGTLNNCIVAGNSGGGSYYSTLNNCIVFYNNNFNYYEGTFSNCCTTPLPPSGAGNITNAPLFVGQVSGNFRLQSNSPCINAGNNAYVAGSTDLDGRPRIVGGTVDIGAYEFQPGVSGEFIGWLSQYSLPTDGSADYADSDSDFMNNWREWIAGTVPVDASSVLRLLNPVNDMSGVIVSWQSVSNRTYFLERGTALGSQPAFSIIQTNIPGLTGETSFTDTNVLGSDSFFYRVGVQP